MTLNNDVILKTWLRTLRYNIEYYEDTFKSTNNRARDNKRGPENMVVGSESNEDSEDEHYVKLWECADSGKSASNLQNSLESVGSNSEVSNFEEDNVSLNTRSTTDLSLPSYVENNVSLGTKLEDSTREITKITEEIIVKKPKKPVVTPRLSKQSSQTQLIYQNLPLKPQIYENLPLRPTELPNPLQKDSDYFTEDSPLYENLSSVLANPIRSRTSSNEDSNFEEEVSSTIQYLEEVLDSVDTFSEDSDIEEGNASSKNTPSGTLESSVSSTSSKIEELYVQDVDEEKFTESSSSFEEYIRKDSLDLSNCSTVKLEPQSLNQKFAKENRKSAFLEEPEPLLPQEVKSIPKPKNSISKNRCSVPIYLRQLQEYSSVRRPKSLQNTPLNTEEVEDFEVFKQYVNIAALNSSRVIVDSDGLEVRNLSGDCEEAVEEPLYQNLLNIVDEKNKDIDTLLLKQEKNSSVIPSSVEDSKTKEFRVSAVRNNQDIENFQVQFREKASTSLNSDIEDSKTDKLNLSFAKESRVSTVFEEAVVQELDIFEIVPERVIFEEEEFVVGPKEDVRMWMSDLGLFCCGETENIMEEKELLKSINQFPKERIERPSENKFPLDDENVEVRRRPSIRRNRISKTTDFDLGRRKQESPINPKNFDIRGIVKFQKPIGGAVITKLNQEYVAYENENFYRINEKTKSKELLCQNVFLKSARYLNSRSKESKEVELRDCQNFTYVLYFDSIKYAKQFMENEKIQVYVTDNKVTIKKTLLRFLGKRSSREILERKGIYKNEPIFGNTLRDIYIKGAGISTSPVPLFIYRVIELIERPENIKSLGLYRTSGNLATIQKIRCEVDNGRLEILDQFCKDPDVLTGSLKLFFRELKEPLIPTEVCEKMAEIVKLNPKQMSSRDFQKIKSILVKNLHEANLETLIVVIQHLLNVVKYKEHNKMDTYNLAVCWGPSMIFSVHGANPGSTFDFPKDIVTQSHDATRLVDFLLGFYELYPGELSGLTKRPESTTGKMLLLKRQESRDSVESSDSSKSQKKSSSNLSLSVDEITKKLIDMIDPHLSSEGLYKKTGSTDKTNKIVKKLNKKKIGELDKYKNYIYDLADALKKYLKDQDGLVTKDTIELVLRATSDNSQSYLEPINRRKLTALIEDTPKKDTFTFLLRHLAKVIDHQSRQNVSRNEIINIWTNVLNYQKKCQVSDDEFAKFLTVAVEVLNDNLPDIVRSSINNNGSTPNRNEIMGEVVKQIKIQQERDRHSRYDNVDCDVSGEASILDDKTEQTKL